MLGIDCADTIDDRRVLIRSVGGESLDSAVMTLRCLRRLTEPDCSSVASGELGALPANLEITAGPSVAIRPAQHRSSAAGCSRWRTTARPFAEKVQFVPSEKLRPNLPQA